MRLITLLLAVVVVGAAAGAAFAAGNENAEAWESPEGETIQVETELPYWFTSFQQDLYGGSCAWAATSGCSDGWQTLSCESSGGTSGFPTTPNGHQAGSTCTDADTAADAERGPYVPPTPTPTPTPTTGGGSGGEDPKP